MGLGISISQGKKSEKFKSEFVNWLDNNSSFFWTQLIALFSFIAIVLQVPLHIKDLFADVEQINKIVLIIIYALQVIFILYVIFVLNSKSFDEKVHPERYKLYHELITKKDLKGKEKQAILKVNDLNTSIFGRYWLFFWKWIFVLYAIFLCRKIIDNDLKDNPAYFIIANVTEILLNNLSMTYLFICFMIIQSPLSTICHNKSLINRQFKKFLDNKSLVFTIVIGFAILHLLLLFLTMVINNTGLVIDKWDTTNDSLSNINKTFSVFSGIFNCCALALMIARLDSKIINVPSHLISILILYAAVQPLYVFFGIQDSAVIVTIVSGATLLFKVYFYLIIAYIIKTGRLADLFMTFPLIKKLVEEQGYKIPPETKKNSSTIDEFIQHLDLMNLVLATSGYRTRKYQRKLREAGGDISM